MTPAYAELRCKTNFTFLRGASHPEELVAKAKELGLSALGICDFASVGGAVRAHVAAQGAGLPIVVGAEVAPRESPPLILLAKSRTGYGALCRMLTRGRRSAPKGQCYLSAADVAAHAGELLCIAAPGLEDFDGGALESRLAALRHAFGLDLYLSVEQHFRQLDFDLGAWIDEVSRRLGIPLVATHDVQFHEKRRKPLHDVLCAIREGTSVAAAGSFLLPNDEFALRAPLEQWNIFERWLGRRGAEAVERTTELVSKCHFSLGELRYEYPSEVVPGGHTPESWLRTVTFEGAAARYPAGVPEKVRGLIEHELALVHEMQYEPYFLTVFDIVRYARSKSILCQGRGSAANSAICYCLGVTAVDPATTELLFERFISKERNEPPDIDIDFEHERREEVIQYVYDKYGRERAGIAAEVICYRGRSAVRDVGKALGLSLDQVDRLAKTLDHYDTADVSAAQLEEAGIAAGDAAVRHVIRFASEITDFPRHLSQHVGGFVISRGLLSELVPIENAAMSGRTVVEWDKNDLDALGLIKVDLLALGMLTATRKAFDLISMHHGVSHGLATIPKEEPETYEMLCHADAVGVFQVESRAQRSMLQRLKPRHFYDLVVEIAIVRPGPIQGQMVHPYLRRRSGEEKYDLNEFPALRPLVERTFGVPLFQEQVMRIAIVGAGFSAGEADRLRRAMGAWKKRGVLEGFYQKFVEGMLGNGYPREFAERIFDQIRGFGEYGFPESHAASFALITYATSWLKRHYPAAFTTALLNSQPMGFYAPAQLVRDALDHGVAVRPVDINKSEWDCTLETEPGTDLRPVPAGEPPATWGARGPAIRLGLRLVKNLERAAAERICVYRNVSGDYTSIDQCAMRAQLDKKAVDALVAADAFASMGIARREAAWHAMGVAPRPPLFESMEMNDVAPDLPPIAAWEQVMRDYESTGLSLRKHPMSFFREELELRGVRPAGDLMQFPDRTPILVAGIVITRQRPSTASGIVFISIEDETGTGNLVVFPDIFDRDRRAARSSTAIIAKGTIERQGDVVHLRAEKLWSFDELKVLDTSTRNFH